MAAAPAAEGAVHALKKLEANKTCVNCGAYNRFGHQNVCEKVRTFVCSSCKSAHQSFSMRVKSVSMSNWTMAQVDALRERNGGGNARAARVWFGRWDESLLRRPTKDDPLEYYKHFIDRVYNDMAFYEAETEEPTTAATTETSCGQLSVAVVKPAVMSDLLDLDAAAPVGAHPTAPFDAFGSFGQEDEWGNFEAAVARTDSDDEFGAFASAVASPLTSSASDEFADFGAAVAPASTHAEAFGAFASVAPASTTTTSAMSFDPFVTPNGFAAVNVPASSGVTSFGSLTSAPASRVQQPMATAVAPVAARKDFSVFDGLSTLLPTSGAVQSAGNDYKRDQTWGGMHMQSRSQQQLRTCASADRQQQQQQFGGHYHQQQQQPMMNGGGAGRNISLYFSPDAPDAFGRGPSAGAKVSRRDPFAGLGL
ncbi:unnamed protein product [Hyaloperonospora brassicae]|uniref:Arf-GAP domain-containing protein n=1 Tax=Hyaloperonospora brassicae TaxID=162125 RepID=A0AAV0UVU3_HYABA|nr:unnamed protein product [Hyaloperonospora brassicae]